MPDPAPTREWPETDLVAARVDATPERQAVVDAPTGDSWTYRELDAWVAEFASTLADRDAFPGRVGVLSAPRPAVLALVHAAWRTGRELVVLNTRLAPGELAAQLDAADVGVLLADDANRDLAAAASANADAAAGVDVRSLGAVAAGDATDAADADVDYTVSRDDVPVTMFTSGSTGDPKAVRVSVGNMMASATASAFRLGVARGDRWLSPLPTYHMGGLAPAVRCALYGATVVLQRAFDADATAAALDEHAATGISLVPTALSRLLDAGWEPGGALRFVLLGGAAASDELLECAERAGVPVHPSWGMTETASQIATATPEQAFSDPDTVGQPLVNATVTVVDGEGDPLLRGETGELVVDGPIVTPGYLDGDGSSFSERGFHTGDRGYRDDDGNVYVTGRVDDMIVTGGENVQPARVAEMLRDLEGVADAAVVGLPDAEWGERVSALVVRADEGDGGDRDRGGTGATAEGIRDAVRDRLAAHEVPKTVGFADSVPRTASGTIDREAVRTRLRED